MRIRLPKNVCLKIEGDARGIAICCGEGLVWVTQPGDVKDYFLTAEERFIVSRKGTVMVEACRDASLFFTPSEPGL